MCYWGFGRKEASKCLIFYFVLWVKNYSPHYPSVQNPNCMRVKYEKWQGLMGAQLHKFRVRMEKGVNVASLCLTYTHILSKFLLLNHSTVTYGKNRSLAYIWACTGLIVVSCCCCCCCRQRQGQGQCLVSRLVSSTGTVRDRDSSSINLDRTEI